MVPRYNKVRGVATHDGWTLGGIASHAHARMAHGASGGAAAARSMPRAGHGMGMGCSTYSRVGRQKDTSS